MTSAVPLLTRTIRDVIAPMIGVGVPLAFFDYPNYANVGDSAIWLGQEQYFVHNHPDSKVIWHADAASSLNGEFPELPSDCVVCITGGGNFGDTWPLHQRLRETLVKRYPDNTILQLPQSIHFQKEANARASAEILSSHTKFKLLVRDVPSLDYARDVMSLDAQLCPDTAFAMGSLSRPSPARTDVFLLMREDGEKAFEIPRESLDNKQLEVNDWLDDSLNLDIRFARWAGKKTRLGTTAAVSAVMMVRRSAYRFAASRNLRRGMLMLARGRVVVTDRLHAHILCCLMGIPHVVLDNSYGKIARFRSLWSSGDGMCEAAASVGDALSLAEKMLHSQENHPRMAQSTGNKPPN